jgi:hypothetical protein
LIVAWVSAIHPRRPNDELIITWVLAIHLQHLLNVLLIIITYYVGQGLVNRPSEFKINFSMHELAADTLYVRMEMLAPLIVIRRETSHLYLLAETGTRILDLYHHSTTFGQNYYHS